MRLGDWNAKNRELYWQTANYDNKTCQLNPYRTLYLQALHKKNMDEDFRGSMWYQMTGEDETDEDDEDDEETNPCGKPEEKKRLQEDIDKRDATSDLRNREMEAGLRNTEQNPCGKPHDCTYDIVLTSMPPQYKCSVCGSIKK